MGTGDPSTLVLPWPSYDSERRSTMEFDQESDVIANPVAIQSEVLTLLR